MATREIRRAMECDSGSMDWTTIGSRIARAATMATAIHQQENARSAAHEANQLAWPTGGRLGRHREDRFGQE